MSLLLLLRADPRADLTADTVECSASCVVTFTVDNADAGAYTGKPGLVWRFDPGDGTEPLFFDGTGWVLDPLVIGDTPTSGDPIEYAYVLGTGGPVDAVLSIVTDDVAFAPAARLEVTIHDGVVPHGTITTDVYSGNGTHLDVVLTVNLDDDAGLTITGWNVDFGDGTFLGVQAGVPINETVPHTYDAPFFGAPRLLIYATGIPA